MLQAKVFCRAGCGPLKFKNILVSDMVISKKKDFDVGLQTSTERVPAFWRQQTLFSSSSSNNNNN